MAFFITIFLLLLLAYTWLINFYHRSWNALPGFQPAVEPESLSQSRAPELRLSIVVAVRNEETNIEKLVESIINQQYEGWFELICVDDHSTDGTRDMLLSMAEKTDRLRLFSLPEGLIGKKSAIDFGIRNAAGSHIVTTDADCYLPPRWLATISACFRQSDAQFIAAPVMLVGNRSPLDLLQRLDFITMQGITGAAVSTGFHWMCNGANLAYSKDAFLEAGGFEGIDHIPSGDDMLLMHKIAAKHPEKVCYLKSKDAIAITQTEPGWRKFFSQRIRWASKAVHYRDRKIFYALLVTYLVNVCYLIFGVLLIFDYRAWWILLLFLLMKIVIEFPFVNSLTGFFGQRWLMMFFPLLQPLHIMYIVVSGWLGRFGSYKWKSRIVKNIAAVKPSKQ